MIKKIFLAILLLIIVPVLIVAGILFFRPVLILNPKNVAFVLRQTKVLKSWKWNSAKFTHEWHAWNDRGFSGSFEGFCFAYGDTPMSVDTCMEKISWSIRLKNLKTITVEPFVVDSSFLKVVPPPDEKKEKTPPPDIYKYWKILWSDLVPDMNFKFHKIIIQDKTFDLSLLKTAKSLNVSALKFTLEADPQKFILRAPTPYPIPKKLPLAKQPIYLRNFVLTGSVKEKGIPLDLEGFLEGIDIKVDSYVDLPLKDDLSSTSFIKKVLLATKAKASLHNVKQTVFEYAPRPYHILPAPFNVMDGSIILNVTTNNHDDKNMINIKADTSIDLKSPHQAFFVDIAGLIPLDLKTYKPKEVVLDLNFRNVKLQLPRLSKKAPPPQFTPDSRFKKKILPPEKKESLPMDLELKALNEKAMHIRTNLLDEALRLNFDLKVINGKVSDGFVKVLPLKTTVFKRPIRVSSLNLKFNKSSDTLIDAVIKFPLPEYKITLKLEGPMSKPRYAFESVPPLPQNDIYAVLLFGRPLADLNPDDKTAASKTNQLLSQGILSLSVLYFLSGSPVEYVGYDPSSKNATAQFGLGKKSSLRVGGGSEGVNSTAVRRSLGKGWYLDTSVQETNKSEASSSSGVRDYGVLLERIISY